MPGDSLKVIVGLGNPGPKHDSDRHNAGVIFLHHLCKSYGGTLGGESKFFGEFGSISVDGHEIKLLFPTTFMNHSGKSVSALCKLFKIEPQHLLVAYYEIDFDVGVTRFKGGEATVPQRHQGYHQRTRWAKRVLSPANRCRTPGPQIHGGELCAEPTFKD